MKKWSFETKRDIMLYMFIIVLLVQTLLYVRVSESPYLFSDTINQTQELTKDIQETFIKDTVRAEQRRALVAIRQAWVQYLSTHPEVELLKEDNTWNEDVVKEIISIIGEPLRLFDTNSELIVADVYTGDILVAPTLKDFEKEKIEHNEKANLLNYHLLAEHNQDQVKDVFTEVLTKIDSDRNTVLTSLMYEPANISDDLNNFSKYPLGSYNRQFIEKIILPYESIGVNGLENMQLVVVISVNEKEVAKPYLHDMNELDDNFSTLHNKMIAMQKGLKASIVVSVLSMIVCILYIRILGYRSVNEK